MGNNQGTQLFQIKTGADLSISGLGFIFRPTSVVPVAQSPVAVEAENSSFSSSKNGSV
jgi:hypothetical protein